VFVQYPPVPTLRNIEWTTKACFKALGCDEPRYHNSIQYMGGFQAYMPTADNLKHIEEMCKFMLKPEIAGPSNWTQQPDGPNGCRAHRNDQSVLSILIERNGWHQYFEPVHFMKYGDYPTLQAWASHMIPNPQDYKQYILPRQCSTRFIPEQLREL